MSARLRRALLWLVMLSAASGASSVGMRSAVAQNGWSQEAKLLPGPTPPAEFGLAEFGLKVAVSGDTMAVGGRDLIMFARDGSGWTQQGGPLKGPLLSLERDPTVGYNIALSADSFMLSESAQLFAYFRDGSDWRHEGRALQPTLTAPGDDKPSLFGNSIAISGDTALIADSAAAYVFTRSGTTWTQQGPALAAIAQGSPVALSGDTAVVEQQGSGASIFVRSGDAWLQQGPSLGLGEYGYSAMAISGDTVAFVTGEGVRVFVRSGATWTEQEPPSVNDQSLRYVDASIALWGDTLVLGVPEASVTDENGAAFIFQRNGTTWTQQGSALAATGITPTPWQIPPYFGSSVAVWGDTVVVGADTETHDAASVAAGAAYVYSDGPCPESSNGICAARCATSDDCAAGDSCSPNNRCAPPSDDTAGASSALSPSGGVSRACGCRLPARSSKNAPLTVALLLLGAFVTRRRRVATASGRGAR